MTVQDDLHKLIVQMFTNTSSGYAWVVAKFGPVEAMGHTTVLEAIRCLESKRDLVECPTHGRIHANRKRMRGQ